MPVVDPRWSWNLHDEESPVSWGAVAMTVLVACLLVVAVWLALGLVEARHAMRIERVARCQTEIALARQADPARVARVSATHAGGGPDASCRLADELWRTR
jgi:hypothetical protein